MADDTSFSAEHALALACVLDELIPASPDGRLPAAGPLGLHDRIAASLRPLPALRGMLDASLTALTELARRRHPRGIAALSASERAALLAELAASDQAVPPILALHAFAAYYRHPTVLSALGIEPRPPHPHGYAVPPNDLSLLEPVRRRAKIYRDA
jgi:hypothetical protein